MIALLFLFFSSYSQKLDQATFSQASNFSWFTIATNQNTLIRISDNGSILEFGTEQASLNNRNYFAVKLLPYQGAVTYYDEKIDSAFKGKIKNIGSCYFTYYPSTDYPEKAGKIKSAGSLVFDYYRKYEDALTGGKIKSIGTNIIAYYTSNDDQSLKGKLKSIGSTSIQYYSSYDDQSLKGKLKSIGSYHFEWTKTSSGGNLYPTLKSGSQRQLINGITYIPQ